VTASYPAARCKPVTTASRNFFKIKKRLQPVLIGTSLRTTVTMVNDNVSWGWCFDHDTSLCPADARTYSTALTTPRRCTVKMNHGNKLTTFRCCYEEESHRSINGRADTQQWTLEASVSAAGADLESPTLGPVGARGLQMEASRRRKNFVHSTFKYAVFTIR